MEPRDEQPHEEEVPDYGYGAVAGIESHEAFERPAYAKTTVRPRPTLVPDKVMDDRSLDRDYCRCQVVQSRNAFKKGQNRQLEYKTQNPHRIEFHPREH